LVAKLEDGRVRTGAYASRPGDLHGAFVIQGPRGAILRIISSGADTEYGWEHVSVSIDHRVPNWEEMCFVKDLFWGDEECVMQLHVPKSEHVNVHPNCLHLWKPTEGSILQPPSILVGTKS
jgi:hypothetical protein